MENEELEDIAAKLESTADYRVLRRLKPKRVLHPPDGSETRTGLFVDVETTGLDPSSDEIIELAMVPSLLEEMVGYSSLGTPFQGYQQPTIPIPEVVRDLTGITDEQLRGLMLDDASVEQMVKRSDLVIAHHADFDRRFLERQFPVFAEKPWGCSMTDVNWRGSGFESTKLEYLALKNGFFFDGHHALFDCFAGIQLLAIALPNGSISPMSQLLLNVTKSKILLQVKQPPFHVNSELRARGYKFSRDSETGEGIWSIGVDAALECAERSFLRSLSIEPTVSAQTAMSRFSGRSLSTAIRPLS